jgi:hypothetical protein
VVVDAVGQHAGTLQVNGGTLRVTAGWIDVAQTLQNNATVDHTGGLVLAQAILIGNSTAGTYNFSGGRIDTAHLSKGTAGGAFNFTGGELHADVIAFSLVNNGGTLAPGHSVGTTQVIGNLSLNAGTLQIELASTESADLVTVTGQAVLGGELDVLLLDGYLPEPGTQWTILSATGGISGVFNAIPSGYGTEVIGNTLVLTYIPEPSLLVPAAGLAALVRRRRA